MACLFMEARAVLLSILFSHGSVVVHDLLFDTGVGTGSVPGNRHLIQSHFLILMYEAKHYSTSTFTFQDPLKLE